MGARRKESFSQGEEMYLILTIGCMVVLSVVFILWIRRRNHQLLLDQHIITAEALYALMTSKQKPLLFDVRLPLDLLGKSEIIPGAKWISPQAVLQNPALIPSEEDVVIYCTCPTDRTSRVILERALAMHFLRLKMLNGGLAAWKASGYTVVPYESPFHLDTVR
jgi:rhodanese-related sulfurtransferase